MSLPRAAPISSVNQRVPMYPGDPRDTRLPYPDPSLEPRWNVRDRWFLQLTNLLKFRPSKMVQFFGIDSMITRDTNTEDLREDITEIVIIAIEIAELIREGKFFMYISFFFALNGNKLETCSFFLTKTIICATYSANIWLLVIIGKW